METINKPFDLNIGDKITLNMDAPQDIIENRYLGGFGTVYIVRSTDPQIGRTALKTPRSDLSITERQLDDFAKEALIWKELPRHPLILPAYDVRQYNKKPFVRMRYIPPINRFGSSLADFMRAGNIQNSIPSYETIEYTFSLLINVLVFLEKKFNGFCHGDIKPSNLLLDISNKNQPQILLSDFGLSKVIKRGTESSSPICGDIRYLAPEVIEGENPNTQSDIYAVGCTMFELITGYNYQVYYQPSNKIIIVNRDEAYASICKLRSEIPEEMVKLVFSCTHENANKRPQTFVELESRIQNIITKLGGKNVSIEFDEKPAPTWITTKESNPVCLYLTEVANVSQNKAEEICSLIGKAADLRALYRIDESDILLDQVFEIIPNFAPALAGRAHGLILKKSYSLAIDTYIEAILEFEKDENLLIAAEKVYGGACITVAQLLPQATSDSHAIEIAETLAEKGIRIFPKDCRGYLALGICQIARNNLDDALHTLVFANSLDPNNSAIKKNLVFLSIMINKDCDLLEAIRQYKLTPSEATEVIRSISK